jgi:hypothetical protein
VPFAIYLLFTRIPYAVYHVSHTVYVRGTFHLSYNDNDNVSWFLRCLLCLNIVNASVADPDPHIFDGSGSGCATFLIAMDPDLIHYRGEWDLLMNFLKSLTSTETSYGTKLQRQHQQHCTGKIKLTYCKLVNFIQQDPDPIKLKSGKRTRFCQKMSGSNLLCCSLLQTPNSFLFCFPFQILSFWSSTKYFLLLFPLLVTCLLHILSGVVCVCCSADLFIKPFVV